MQFTHVQCLVMHVGVAKHCTSVSLHLKKTVKSGCLACVLISKLQKDVCLTNDYDFKKGNCNLWPLHLRNIWAPRL